MEIQNKKIIRPVLLVDDEPEDISDLDQLLEEAGTRMLLDQDACGEDAFPYILPNAQIRQYAAHSEDAVGIMLESMLQEQRFSAIIADNHMNGIFGEDFLRIIGGFPIYCSSRDESDSNIPLEEMAKTADFTKMLELGSRHPDEDILDFLEESFSNVAQYVSFVKYYFQETAQRPLMVIMCGNPDGVDTNCLDAFLIAKPIGRRRGYKTSCEKDVLYLLGERGIIPQHYLQRSLEDHYRLGKNVHPNQREFKDPKRKIGRKN